MNQTKQYKLQLFFYFSIFIILIGCGNAQLCPNKACSDALSQSDVGDNNEFTPPPKISQREISLTEEVQAIASVHDLDSDKYKMMLRLKETAFESGESRLSDEAKSNIEKIILFLIDQNITNIKIACHTDSVGNADTNLLLSFARANNVANFINILAEDTFIEVLAEGQGEFNPITSNDTPKGRALNRRIEFYF